MFVLVELRDTVTIKPADFRRKLQDAVTDALNRKFANKVIHNVGLCIALWDIMKMDDSYIFPLDGSSHTVVNFRFIVFRPFLHEVIEGTLSTSSNEGICVSLGFFDDIFIPADQLMEPSKFDEANQQWIWIFKNADDDSENEMRMEQGDKIRFRVCETEFVDLTPSKPEKVGGDPSSTVPAPDSSKKSPFTIRGSVRDPGLGMTSWWE